MIIEKNALIMISKTRAEATRFEDLDLSLSGIFVRSTSGIAIRFGPG